MSLGLTLRAGPFGTFARTVGDYLMLLLLTGIRRMEAASLTWDQVDLPNRTLVVDETKNHDRHILPIADWLLELLKERRAALPGQHYVFPSEGTTGHLQEPRPQMRRVTEASGVTFIIHDLRRTFITSAESLDISTYVLSRLANHRLGHAVTRNYIITDIERLRAPMQKIADYLLSVSEIKRRAVVAMPKRAR